MKLDETDMALIMDMNQIHSVPHFQECFKYTWQTSSHIELWDVTSSHIIEAVRRKVQA